MTEQIEATASLNSSAHVVSQDENENGWPSDEDRCARMRDWIVLVVKAFCPDLLPLAEHQVMLANDPDRLEGVFLGLFRVNNLYDACKCLVEATNDEAWDTWPDDE